MFSFIKGVLFVGHPVHACFKTNKLQEPKSKLYPKISIRILLEIVLSNSQYQNVQTMFTLGGGRRAMSKILAEGVMVSLILFQLLICVVSDPEQCRTNYTGATPSKIERLQIPSTATDNCTKK